jgi:hypothetical protein
MKQLLQSFYQKEIENIYFNQNIEAYIKQYTDGEIYETEISSYEPQYKIIFKDQTIENLDLQDLLVKLFYKTK